VAEDAWDALMLMLQGMEHEDVHKKEKQFGRRVGALETCGLKEGHKCWRNLTQGYPALPTVCI